MLEAGSAFSDARKEEGDFMKKENGGFMKNSNSVKMVVSLVAAAGMKLLQGLGISALTASAVP